MEEDTPNPNVPLYFHPPCPTCVYVGRDFIREGERAKNKVDIWLHRNPSGRHMMIRRYSSDPADYHSFCPSDLEQERFVHITYRISIELARVKGLLPRPIPPKRFIPLLPV